MMQCKRYWWVSFDKSNNKKQGSKYIIRRKISWNMFFWPWIFGTQYLHLSIVQHAKWRLERHSIFLFFRPPRPPSFFLQFFLEIRVLENLRFPTGRTVQFFGTKGQRDKLKILPRDETGRDSLSKSKIWKNSTSDFEGKYWKQFTVK